MLVLIYLFSMIQDIHSQFNHTAFQKYKALTPATADSLIIDSISTQIFNPDCKIQGDGTSEPNTLFMILQQRFEEKNQQIEDPRPQKDQFKSLIDEKIQECQFKIGIHILNENGDSIKSFSKAIIRSMESEDQITLIFDRQHQKIKIQTDTKYIIEVFIETLDSFSKSIWQKKLKISDNAKRWSVMTLNSEKAEKQAMCLNIQLEKVGKFFIKPLSFKLPSSTIDQFFDYKYKLLNKSQLLSSLKSIRQLKGILLALTKQNMGSRIIQKLLSKAKQGQIQLVINQLKPSFKEMIFDRYGNYVFQKIFQMSNMKQKNLCLSKLKPDMLEILKSKQGTHSIQVLIDNLNHEQVISWFSSFSKQDIIDLSTNRFSMHFILKLLNIMPVVQFSEILFSQFKKLATDKQGIVVLKNLLSLFGANPVIRYRFLEQCQNSLNEVAFTQYGHYIVEQMFHYYNFYQLQNILNYITVYIRFFCLNQYSSSIVRKSIELYGDCFSISAIKSILEQDLVDLMENSSGEFVLHRLMELTVSEKDKKLLMNEMMLKSKEVKCYEKRQKWLKFFKLI